MTEEPRKRRIRGASPRGDFETAKASAMNSEDERMAANREKTRALRAARLTKEGASPPTTGSTD